MTPVGPRYDAMVKVQMPTLASSVGYVTVQALWADSSRPASVQRWRGTTVARVAWVLVPRPSARNWEEEKP